MLSDGSLSYLSKLKYMNRHTSIYSSSSQDTSINTSSNTDIYSIMDYVPPCCFGDNAFDHSVTAWSPAVHGVMIGREAYNNPWRWADIDRYYYKKTNPGYSRRDVLERYLDYAELCQLEDRYRSTIAYLCKPLHNFFHGCLTNRLYKQKLDLLLKAHCSPDHILSVGYGGVSPREVITAALEDTIPDSFLDEFMGPDGVMITTSG